MSDTATKNAPDYLREARLKAGIAEIVGFNPSALDRARR